MEINKNITDYNKCFICLDIIEMEFNSPNKYIIILNNSNECIDNECNECNCKLSLHIHCLKEWIFSQCEKNNIPYIECPICHKKLIIKDFNTNDSTLFNHKYLTDKIIENWISEYKIHIKLENCNETETITIYYNNENISNIDFINHPTYYVSCKNAIFCFSMTAITYFSFIIIKHLVN